MAKGIYIDGQYFYEEVDEFYGHKYVDQSDFNKVKEELSANTESDVKRDVLIDKQGQEISANTEALKENSELDAVQGAAISANTEAIEENKLLDIEQGAAISANTEAISANTEAIEENKLLDIEQGAAISANTEAIEELNNKISYYDEILSSNTEDIEELKNIYSSHTEDIEELEEKLDIEIEDRKKSVNAAEYKIGVIKEFIDALPPMSGIQYELDSIHLESDESGLIHKLYVNDELRGEINIPKDNFLKNVTYNKEYKSLTFEFIVEDGSVKPIIVDVGDLFDEYYGGNGLILEDDTFSIKVKDGEKFLKCDENGIFTEGISSVKDIEGMISTLENKIEDEISGITQSISEVNALVTDEETRAISAETDILSSITALELVDEKFSEDIDKINSSISDINSGITELETEIDDLNKFDEHLGDRVSILETKSLSLENSVNIISSKLSKIPEDIAIDVNTIFSEISEINYSITEVVDNIELINTNIEGLSSELNQFDNKIESACTNVKGEISSVSGILKNDISTVALSVTSIQNEQVELSKAQEEISTKIDTLSLSSTTINDLVITNTSKINDIDDKIIQIDQSLSKKVDTEIVTYLTNEILIIKEDYAKKTDIPSQEVFLSINNDGTLNEKSVEALEKSSFVTEANLNVELGKTKDVVLADVETLIDDKNLVDETTLDTKLSNKLEIGDLSEINSQIASLNTLVQKLVGDVNEIKQYLGI